MKPSRTQERLAIAAIFLLFDFTKEICQYLLNILKNP